MRVWAARLLWVCQVLCSLCLAATFAFADGQSASASVSWPRWRGPNGDGVSLETSWSPAALQGEVNVLWRKNVGVGYSSPSIEGGRLYIMGVLDGQFTVLCLDAATSREIWKNSLKKTALEPQATPAVDGDRVYCLNKAGALFCLKTSNGDVLWQANLLIGLGAKVPSAGWAASPAVEGGLLLVNANTKQAALDKMTGNVLWEIEDQAPMPSWGSYATPFVSDVGGRRQAFFLGPSSLFAVEVPAGKLAWAWPHRDANHPVADSIVSGGQVFISVTDRCALLDAAAAEPRVLWSSSDLTTWLSTPVLAGGYLYGSHLPPEFSSTTWEETRAARFPFRCLDWKTGKVMWERSMASVTLAAAGGKLIMIELDGTLHVAEATPAGFKEIATTGVLADAKGPRIYAVPPVLCNGRLYCRNFAGELTCIDVSGSAAG